MDNGGCMHMHCATGYCMIEFKAFVTFIDAECSSAPVVGFSHFCETAWRGVSEFSEGLGCLVRYTLWVFHYLSRYWLRWRRCMVLAGFPRHSFAVFTY
jgi:hypothetical protein